MWPYLLCVALLTMSGPTYYGLDMARLLINPINRYTTPGPNPKLSSPHPDPNLNPNP